MRTFRIGQRLIPAACVVSVIAASTAIANNNIKEVSAADDLKTELYTEPKNNSLSAQEVLLYLGWGALGGVLGTMGTIGINRAINRHKIGKTESATSEYFDNKFQKDSDTLYGYMVDVLAEAISDDSFKINLKEYYAKTNSYTFKYPSRGQYVLMFPTAIQDKRLSAAQKEVLALYIILKATAASDEEEQMTKNLIPFLDGIDNYEAMVEEFKARTVSSSDTVSDDEVVDEEDDDEQTAIEFSSKADKASEKTNFNYVQHNLKFSDIGAQDEAIKMLKKKILFPIKYPEAFKNNNMEHCFLLYGPPGTGKTLLSEALVNETKAHFIKLNANELTSKWVGETEENWRNLFKGAFENQPSIILIDEFDGIAAKRGHGDVYNDKVVNQILGLISDIEKNDHKIYIIATSNRLDMIDKAMLRAGRFGTQIEVKSPQSKEDVLQILNIHLNKKPHANESIDKNKIAEILFEEKATGADIASIVNNAFENAKDRNNLFEKMDNGTFKTSDMKNIKIIQSDFDKVINEFSSKNKKVKTIGFKQGS